MLVCDPNAIEDELDVWTFGHYFNSVIGSVVQYNGFDRYTIEDICETLTDPLGGDPLDRYATMTFEVKGGSCSRTEYENVVTVLSHENPNG